MERKRPVRICIIRHNPNRDPNFHHIERFLGDGRSISLLFTIRIRGCLFRMGLVIYINGILFVYGPFVIR